MHKRLNDDTEREHVKIEKLNDTDSSSEKQKKVEGQNSHNSFLNDLKNCM